MFAGIFEGYFRVRHVLTLDLHAPPEQGFFRHIPCDELRGAPLFKKALAEYGITSDLADDSIILVASDAGPEKI